jgi:hypothetical protein
VTRAFVCRYITSQTKWGDPRDVSLQSHMVAAGLSPSEKKVSPAKRAGKALSSTSEGSSASSAPSEPPVPGNLRPPRPAPPPLVSVENGSHSHLGWVRQAGWLAPGGAAVVVDAGGGGGGGGQRRRSSTSSEWTIDTAATDGPRHYGHHPAAQEATTHGGGGGGSDDAGFICQWQWQCAPGKRLADAAQD